MRKLNIVIDVDGCIVVSEYPKIGRLIRGAKETINEWHEQGHTIIINTCRAGQMAIDAKNFLLETGISHHYFNENPISLIQRYGTDTRKLSGDVYIDDKNIGGLPSWQEIDRMVQEMANHKPVVVCVIGESGSGKSSLVEYIESVYGVKMIESYTDRPKRSETETGHTFLDAAEYDLLKEEEMIAKTVFGNYRYCCLESDVLDYNTYVIDENGYLMLLSKYRDKYDIYSIRVKCDEDVRLLRAKDKSRVERDRGKFMLPDNYFNFVVETTNREVDDYLDLHDQLKKWFKRGF